MQVMIEMDRQVAEAITTQEHLKSQLGRIMALLIMLEVQTIINSTVVIEETAITVDLTIFIQISKKVQTRVTRSSMVRTISTNLILIVRELVTQDTWLEPLLTKLIWCRVMIHPLVQQRNKVTRVLPIKSIKLY